MLEIRILAVVEPGAGAVQVLLPVLVTVNRAAQVTPESRESSIFTPPLKPTEAHFIVCWLPAAQFSPPLGARMVILGASGGVMAKSALLTSETLGVIRLVTLILAWEVA